MYNNENYRIQNRVITQVAEELGLDKDIVFKIVKSQWDFLKEIITEQENEDKRFFSLKIRYLGMFGVKNNMFKITRLYKHLHVPRSKVVKHIDPRRQNTN